MNEGRGGGVSEEVLALSPGWACVRAVGFLYLALLVLALFSKGVLIEGFETYFFVFGGLFVAVYIVLVIWRPSQLSFRRLTFIFKGFLLSLVVTLALWSLLAVVMLAT